nr:MAG TPA: hypothetical protein [Inoviridae sp.]
MCCISFSFPGFGSAERIEIQRKRTSISGSPYFYLFQNEVEKNIF